MLRKQAEKFGLLELAKAILEHENTKAPKSPFLLTDSLRNVIRNHGTVLGFPVEQPAKDDRLVKFKRSRDVLAAIAEQLRRYAENPEGYGHTGGKLSVKEALGIFDQTGGNQFRGKIDYINQKFPWRPVDTMPLDFFTGGSSLHSPAKAD